MHPRNPYRDKPPDFAALARRHPCFARHVHGAQAQLDWGDPAALVELSRALLLEDFGVHWDIPPDRLCPTIPSRLNYLLWIEDLLALRAATPAAQPAASTPTSAASNIEGAQSSESLGCGSSPYRFMAISRRFAVVACSAFDFRGSGHTVQSASNTS